MQSATSASPHPIGPTSPLENPLAAIFSDRHSRKRWHDLPHFPDSASSSNGELNRIGSTNRFSYARQTRVAELSPQSSTLDSDSSGPEPRSLTPSEVDGERITDIEDMDADMNVEEIEEPVEEDENSDFEVEEVHSSDIEPDTDARPLEARQPDDFEDAESVYSQTSSHRSGIPHTLDPNFVNRLRDLKCGGAPGDSGVSKESMKDGDDAFLQHRKNAKKERRKRWSASSLKRGITESIGSGSDEEDRDVRREDAMEVGGDENGGRRLRRKIGDRMSLSADDIPPPIFEDTNEGSESAEVKVTDSGNDVAENMDIDDDA